MKKTSKEKKVLFLLDSNAIVHRAFHALPPLATREGEPSGAVYGFALTLLSILENQKPDFLLAAFDLKGPTFRHEKFEDYKAKRVKAPDELYAQIPRVKEMLKNFGVPIFEKQSYEADDVIGTIVKQDFHVRRTSSHLRYRSGGQALKPTSERESSGESAADKNSEDKNDNKEDKNRNKNKKEKEENGKLEKVIATGDNDALQLVDDDVRVFMLRRGIKDTVIYDREAVVEKYGLSPEQIVDLKALWGDASDNIPGVAGVGEKTAVDLLSKFQTLENLYDNLDQVEKKAVREKLEKDQEKAFLSQDLARIRTDVEFDFDLNSCRTDDLDWEALGDFFDRMGFRSLKNRLKNQGRVALKEVGNGKGKNGASVSAESSAGDKIKNKNKKEKRREDGKISLKIISDKKEAEKVFEEIRKNRKFSYAFFGERNFSGVGVSVDQSSGYFLSGEFWPALEKFFRDENILKVGFEVKDDLKELFQSLSCCHSREGGNPAHASAPSYFLDARLRGHDNEDGFELKSFCDTQIGAYLLSSANTNDFEKLIFEEFGEELENAQVKSGQASLLAETADSRQKYLAEKAAWILRLDEFQKEKLAEIKKEQSQNQNVKKDILWLRDNLEEPLKNILARMEFLGVGVDKNILQKASRAASDEIEKLQAEIYSLAGEEFNINSPKQLAPILFERLGIPSAGIRKGKSGQLSTASDQLAKIQHYHEIVPLIEDYREMFKVKTTYADALPKLVAADGRIHARFNQAVAATGRLSSSEPNLQNIPKRGRLAGLIRSAFVAEKGKILVSADYSQIDLRVAAHLSRDKKMSSAFFENKDIHRATAAWVNGVAEDQVDRKMRNEAKALNFGVLYGMGVYGFMRDSGVDRQRAEFFISHYMQTFSGLKKFLDSIRGFARKNNYVETELGRRRYIGGINSPNIQARAAAERMAINLPVQGLAADIMKLAMIRVNDEVVSKFNKSKNHSAQSESVRMILQIHDELIFEVDEKIADQFQKQVKTCLEKVYALQVPLVVETSKGKDWNSL